MLTEALSEEEENHLYNLSIIPLIAIFVLIMGYFVHLMQIGSLKSVSDYVFRIGLLMAILEPVAFFGTFEWLYSRKVKKTASFYMRRFVGKMAITLAMMASLFGIFSILLYATQMLTNEFVDLVGSFLMWTIIWATIAFRFRKVFSKLYHGQW
jgi:cobalamin biosynthesis protein CobD/CbiB